MTERACNRIRAPLRRDCLRLGVLSALGITGFGSRSALALGSRLSSRSAPPLNCILLWLDGGPSHLETFDLKPHVPLEVRGPFRPIATTVPGLEICEHLPKSATIARHLAVIRSLTSPLGEHGLANQYLLTGHQPSTVIRHPSLGSISAWQSGRDRPEALLPPYVAIPETRFAGAGFLGPGYEPFEVRGDPAKPDFQVADLTAFPGIDPTRLERRRSFLQALDQVEAKLDQPTGGNKDSIQQQAWRLALSPEARDAFDITAEPAAVRARYGMRTFGQSCLLARRLVERGVNFVTVHFDGWDTHEDLVLQLQSGYSGANPGVGLIPTFDQGFASLVSDLQERGLLENTLIVAMGEFGRTPKLNTRGGRDHWPRVFSAVLAGGGVQGGQVLGSSDRVGESPRDMPVTPADLAASICQLLKIDPQQMLPTSDGRPIAVNASGKVIPGLM
ncbi:MAG: DUF1501 domain-containing protein [Planctomycetaceae bacterium]